MCLKKLGLLERKFNHKILLLNFVIRIDIGYSDNTA